MVPDYCTKYKWDQPILLWHITTNTQKCMKKWTLITQLWQRAKCYFTSLSNASYLITVTNMKKKHVLLWHITTFNVIEWRKVAIPPFPLPRNIYWSSWRREHIKMYDWYELLRCPIAVGESNIHRNLEEGRENRFCTM